MKLWKFGSKDEMNDDIDDDDDDEDFFFYKNLLSI